MGEDISPLEDEADKPPQELDEKERDEIAREVRRRIEMKEYGVVKGMFGPPHPPPEKPLDYDGKKPPEEME